MAHQARKLTLFFDGQQDRPTHLLRDRDTKFTEHFDAILESEGLEVKEVIRLEGVHCDERLGGLLKSYSRAAA